MDTSEDILVVILAVFLAIFLLLGIIALVKSIQVLNQLKRITSKAEDIAEKAEAVGEFFQQAANKIAFTRFISNIVQAVKSKSKKKD